MVFAKKNNHYRLLTGTVVDSMGYFIPNQKVALVNRKGNDKQIIFADDYGIFTFKVKRKNIQRFAVCAYSDYANSKKISLSEFVLDNKLTLPTNRFYLSHNFINFNTGKVSLSVEALNQINRSFSCRRWICVETYRYPFAFVNADYIRSYFPMVK
jgi:hypothetical protein